MTTPTPEKQPMYLQITAEQFQKAVSYCPLTGVFTWKIKKGKAKPGFVAGYVCPKGYVKIEIYGSPVLAHRLAWFLYYGQWPKSQIDHINGIKCDNRITNLRDVTQSQNQCNVGTRKDNTSGFRGVTFHKHRRKWVVEGRRFGKRACVGYYDSIEDAKAARIKWESANDPEFRRSTNAK
jgi:hypothetical protein